MRLCVSDNGYILNLQSGLSCKSCDYQGCETTIIVSDDIDLKHPNCICDRKYALCLVHIRVGYICPACECPCTAYDCFQTPCGTVKCADQSCNKMLCTECSDMGRIHCEYHRERGG